MQHGADRLGGVAAKMVKSLDDDKRKSASFFLEVPQQLPQTSALALWREIGIEEGRGRFEAVLLAVGEETGVLFNQAWPWVVGDVSGGAVAFAMVQMLGCLAEVSNGSHNWMLCRCVRVY